MTIKPCLVFASVPDPLRTPASTFVRTVLTPALFRRRTHPRDCICPNPPHSYPGRRPPLLLWVSRKLPAQVFFVLVSETSFILFLLVSLQPTLTDVLSRHSFCGESWTQHQPAHTKLPFRARFFLRSRCAGFVFAVPKGYGLC